MLPKFLFISILSSLIITHSYSQCLDNQKNLLLQLKNELKFNSSVSFILLQWNQTDEEECCKWYGVKCDAAGNVISLKLDDEDLSGEIGNSWSIIANFSSLNTLSLVRCRLNGSFPNMMFHLPYLQNLDLSYNRLLSGSIPPFTHTGSLKVISLIHTNFSGSIPDSISNLKTLSFIDLSDCQFTGSIPSTFANLTQLTHAYLSGNFFTGSFSSLFVGHSNLVALYLSDNLFSGKIPHQLFGLPSLLELGLSNNQFIGQFEVFPIVNLSNIVYLSLGGNHLEGPIPDFFFSLHSLEYLFLSGNMFNGSFQVGKIQSLVNLAFLDLSDNNLSIDANSFQLGKIQGLVNLTFLDLSGNNLSIDDANSNAYELPQLKQLNLASCNLHVFPSFIKHSDVTDLDLSNNWIVGEIPSWIWGSQLYHLNLSSNLLTCMQKPYRIPASLLTLDLHSNQLMGEMHLSLEPNAQPWFISLANNSLSGPIPTSLCSATQLEVLNLSANKLNGTIPSYLVENNMFLMVLDLRRNNFSGRIPDKFSLNCKLEYLDLNNNALEGKVPVSLENCESLEFMNIANNIIGDTFPCRLSPSLRVLVLHSNRFHGEVRCLKSWPDLQILDISSNNFNGSLQSVNFSSWRRMVLNNDTQSRHNHSSSDFMRTSYDYTYGVSLTMKGQELELVKIWPDFTVVDLSCNNFGGEIPNAIGNLSSLHLLNLSHNALSGSIPKSFGKLGELESLDLSRNQLTGPIPEELARLTFLSFLNVSYNKLAGNIPNGRQLQTFSADSFKGNPRLCGFNLNISCSSHTGDDSDLPHENDKEEKREIEWEYVCVALGYIVGLGSFVWLLVFHRSFRWKYFDKVDEIVEEIIDGRNRRRKRKHARRAAVLRNRVRRQ